METTKYNLDFEPASGKDSSNESSDHVKKCPFCAEQIQQEAIKCRYCHEFLNKSPCTAVCEPAKKKGFSNVSIVCALLFIGPLALPMVLSNPRYKPATKIIITIIVLAVTALLLYVMVQAYERVLNQLDVLNL